MKDFSIIAIPLTEIVKKTIGFKSEIKQEKVLNFLKEKLISTLLLYKKKLRLNVILHV